MNEFCLGAARWLLHAAVGGSLLLGVTCLLMRWIPQPARRQRLGDLGMIAALLVVVLSLVGPSWLIVSWSHPGEQLPEDAGPLASPSPGAQPAARQAEAPAPKETVATPPSLPARTMLLLDAAPSPDAGGKAAPAEPIDSGMTAITSAVAVFMAVAGFFLARLVLGYIALARLLWRAEPPPPEVSGLFDAMAAGTRWVRLLVSRRLVVPLSCGLVRPTVVLPLALCRSAAPHKLRWVFAHELTHLRRRDAWSALVFGLGQVCFFLVPWFWWLRRQVRLCQEYIADAAAAGQDQQALQYAEFLVSLAHGPALPAGAAGVSANGSDLFRRVSMLLKDLVNVETRCPRPWSVVAAGILVALGVLTSGLTLRADAAQDDPIVIIIQPRKTDKPAAAGKNHEARLHVWKDSAGTAEKTIHFWLSPKDKDAIEISDLLLDLLPGETRLERFSSLQTLSEALGEGGNLEPLYDALKRLEGLKKEGKLTPEAIQCELQKALAQAKTAAGLAKLGGQIRKDTADGWEYAGAKQKAMRYLVTVLNKKYDQVNTSPSKPRLGVTVQPVSPALADQLNLPQDVGLLVTEVYKDTPAEKVGIKVNDVLLKIDGAQITGDLDGFTKLIGNLKADTPLDVVVMRKGQFQKIGTVALAAVPKATFLETHVLAGMDDLIVRVRNVDKKRADDNNVLTMKVTRSGNDYMVRFEEGDVRIAVSATVKDRSATLNSVAIWNGNTLSTYNSMAAVPEALRPRVRQMMELLQ